VSHFPRCDNRREGSQRRRWDPFDLNVITLERDHIRLSPELGLSIGGSPSMVPVPISHSRSLASRRWKAAMSPYRFFSPSTLVVSASASNSAALSKYSATLRM